MLSQVICDLKSEGIFGIFYRKELQKPMQAELRIQKVMKTKGDDKLCVKWKGYDNSFTAGLI